MGKGARYEEEVCTLVESELNMGNLGIDPTLARMKKNRVTFQETATERSRLISR
jgi:hypothetical protein